MGKYRNKKTEVDGIKFDSVKESKRYLYLKDKERLGVISNLRLQQRFVLQNSFKINGHTIRAIEYKADFVYELNGNEIVEDVKASFKFQDPVFKLKKKLFAYKYQKEIKEIIDPNTEIN